MTPNEFNADKARLMRFFADQVQKHRAMREELLDGETLKTPM